MEENKQKTASIDGLSVQFNIPNFTIFLNKCADIREKARINNR